MPKKKKQDPKKKLSKRLAAQERKTSKRISRRLAADREQAAHDRDARRSGQRPITLGKTGRPKLTPGEKARIKNRRTHGQDVPVKTKGKLDKPKRKGR